MFCYSDHIVTHSAFANVVGRWTGGAGLLFVAFSLEVRSRKFYRYVQRNSHFSAYRSNYCLSRCKWVTQLKRWYPTNFYRNFTKLSSHGRSFVLSYFIIKVDLIGESLKVSNEGCVPGSSISYGFEALMMWFKGLPVDVQAWKCIVLVLFTGMARKKIREYDSKRILKEHLKKLAGIDIAIKSAQVLFLVVKLTEWVMYISRCWLSAITYQNLNTFDFQGAPSVIYVLPWSLQVTESTDFTKLAEQEPWLNSTRLVVKPDMLFGKRGKSGLVGSVHSLSENSEVFVKLVGWHLHAFVARVFMWHMKTEKDTGILW